MELTKLFILLSIVSSLVFTRAAPHLRGDFNAPPHYEFHYAVHDSHTRDIKDQFEHRRGDYVIGRYSLLEPDGQRRVVEYSSDPIIGFTAKVHRELP